MRVADIMRTSLQTINAEATIADAVAALTDAQVNAMPVIDRHGRAVGVCSTRDVLQAESRCHTAAERDRLFERGLVLEIMTAWPATVKPYMDVREVAREMARSGVPRFFVELEGALVGVVSQTDIVAAVASARV
jgi:CBS-domain-containing membrane protein